MRELSRKIVVLVSAIFLFPSPSRCCQSIKFSFTKLVLLLISIMFLYLLNFIVKYQVTILDVQTHK